MQVRVQQGGGSACGGVLLAVDSLVWSLPAHQRWFPCPRCPLASTCTGLGNALCPADRIDDCKVEAGQRFCKHTLELIGQGKAEELVRCQGQHACGCWSTGMGCRAVVGVVVSMSLRRSPLLPLLLLVSHSPSPLSLPDVCSILPSHPTQPHAPSPHPWQPDGSLLLHAGTSCHKSRSALGFPDYLPVVNLGGAASRLKSAQCEAFLYHLGSDAASRSIINPILLAAMQKLQADQANPATGDDDAADGTSSRWPQLVTWISRRWHATHAPLAPSSPHASPCPAPPSPALHRPAPPCRRPGSSALQPSSQPMEDAAQFAARYDTTVRAQAAAAAAAAEQPPSLPGGCEQRSDGTVVVCDPSAAYATLAAANRKNKPGTRAAALPEELKMQRKNVEAVLSTASLWAALHSAGGLHLVRGVGVRAACCLVGVRAACCLVGVRAACCFAACWSWAAAHSAQACTVHQHALSALHQDAAGPPFSQPRCR